jgi:PAS domain S-box-containing protein
VRHLWLKTPLLLRDAPEWLGRALLILLSLTLIWGSIAWNLRQEHRHIEADARTDASNLARTFEENLLRSVEAIDQQLILFRALYSRDPTHFDFSTVPGGGNLLQGLTLQVGVIDRQGFVQISNLGPVAKPVDLSDREHFRVHLNGNADVLFIGKPLTGRVSNELVVQLSRRIVDADGRFAGVIVASLDPTYFLRFHRSLDIGPSSVFVVGQDAVVRASSPVVDYIGKNIAGARLLDEAARQKQGVFLGRMMPGSPESYVGYRTLSEFPLLVAVGLDAKAAFADYWQSVWWDGEIGIGLSLALLVVGGALIRYRAEQQRTTNLVKRLIDASPLAVVGLNQNHHVTIWNRSAERIFGYTAEDVLGQPYDLIPPEEQLLADAMFARTEQGISLQDIEVRRRRKDGTIIDVRFSGAVFQPGDEEEGAYLFMMEDITERKRAAKKLQESEARLRGFLTASPDAIVVVDESGKIVMASQCTEDMLGYKPEELIGKPLDILVPERGRATHGGRMHGYLHGPKAREMASGRELYARRKDGSEFPAEIGLSSYRGDAGLFVIAAVRDVTKQWQAREELRLSEARFRSVFDAAGHGMAWVGIDDRILKVNAAYCRITGYSEDELLARAVRDMTYPDDVAESQYNLRKMVAGEIGVFQTEKRYIRKDGTIIWAQLNMGLVHDAAGAPLHYIVQIQDITEARRAAAQLRQAQKMEAVGQLTAGIAHDFNNILGAVIGNLDLASEQLTTDAAAAGHHATEALDAALSAAELVKRLLAFSRQQPLQPRPMDIKQTITGIVPLLRPSLGGQIQIQTSTPADLWPAVADSAQVESALLNLALNARDAMPNGGVLSLDAANITIDADLFDAWGDLKPGDYVAIAVTDTGTGMSPETLARAFEPFFTTKGVGAGSGLGLSMVLGTMQQLGGTAMIYSEPGHGTTIRLFLPRAAAVADTGSVQGAAPPAHPTGTERILLVEDNDLMRDGVQAMIQSLGYAVEVVPNADAALALWDRGERFDLVFSDIVMPGQYNGIGLARELRERDPHIRVLLTSGFTGRTAVLGELEELGLELLQKPYRKAVLADRLRAILD